MAVDYHAPKSMNEALDLLARGGVRVVAGGTDLYPAAGATGPRESLLDITGIGELRGIVRARDGWRIGAATRWSDVAEADLPPVFDGLRAAAREVGSVQIQNAGTVAGNIVNASPAADGVPPLLTLDARVELISARGGRREVPLADFITGVRRVALDPGEMVAALYIPAQPDHATGCFVKLGSRSYLVISIAMVAAVVGCDAHGRINLARVAVGACSPVARRMAALEQELIGRKPAQVVVRPDQLNGLAPIDDVRGSAQYRREVAAELVTRAIREAAHG
jgi:CO/xanthine dehydrogenase FAD-binding subunit